MYRLVKDLYKTRSLIVHGKAFPKKGTLNYESLFITARASNVPLSQLKLLLGTTIDVINAVFGERELLEVIQTRKNEQKTALEIDEFFAKRLLDG